MAKLTHTREHLTYARLLVEVNVEGMQVKTIPITSPIRVQINLDIKFKAISEYYEGYHRIRHRDSTSQKDTNQ